MPEFWLGLDRFLLYVKREFRFILATFAASGIGYLGSAAAPIIVQAMIDAGLDHPRRAISERSSCWRSRWLRP